MATADEETGGRWGVQWAIENVPSLRGSEYAFNEGGYINLSEAGVPDRYEISNGQKVILQLRLKAKGTSGHASMPHSDNPNVKLVHALEAVTKWETPYNILPSVKEFFAKMAPKQPPDKREFLAKKRRVRSQHMTNLKIEWYDNIFSGSTFTDKSCIVDC